MWKQLWNWVTGRGWNSLEGSEEDRKMWECLELPRDFVNGFSQNADGNMDNKIQAEVSQINLLGTRAKVILAVLEQRDWQYFAPALETWGNSNMRELS